MDHGELSKGFELGSVGWWGEAISFISYDHPEATKVGWKRHGMLAETKSGSCLQKFMFRSDEGKRKGFKNHFRRHNGQNSVFDRCKK